ncbi:hypothetical protein MASR2M18_16050 [Ignavibacteria bacterium]
MLSATAAAQNFDINAESASADYLLLRSMRGLLPIGEHAVLPQPLTILNGQFHSSANDAAFLDASSRLYDFQRYIEDYYAPLLWLSDSDKVTPDSTAHWLELQKNGHLRTLSYDDGNASVIGDVTGMIRGGTASLAGEHSAIGLARSGGRAIGRIGENFGFMLDLSNGVRLEGEPRTVASTDPILGRSFKFVSDEQKFFDRYIGYVQYQSSWLRASFGRQPFALGFSPVDNLLFSRNTPLFDAFLLDVPYKSIRFTSTHGAVEGVDTAGNAYQNKYIGAHRLSITPSDWFSASITDMIVYSGRGLDFAYLNPLGFYVSTGLGTPQKSRDDNSLLAIDAALRPWNGAMLYGDLLIDDLSFSRLDDTSWTGNSNKNAWQIGLSQTFDAADSPLLLTGEYVRINPFVYSHRGIANSWTHLGAPIGYDMQPNSDRWALQAKYWFAPRFFVQIDLDYGRHGENYLDSAGKIITKDYDIGGRVIAYPVGNVGGDALRGDADFLYPESFRVGNNFLRGNISYTRRVRLQFFAEIMRNFFADLRLNYQNRNGGNMPGEYFWATFELRVGY